MIALHMLRYRLLDDYPSEPFTDIYWIKFVDIDAARLAKKKLDNHSFFGKNLHVCYAPEYESVQDTREKLQQRREVIARRTGKEGGGRSLLGRLVRREEGGHC